MSLRWSMIKKIFLVATYFETKKFEKALASPHQAQKETLEEILISLNIRCGSLEEFRKQFPLTGEEQLSSLKERLAGQTILTSERTSGSSGQPKDIPYNAQLLSSFHHMFRLWSRDVLSTQELKTGRFFFSVSPQGKEQGFKEDSEYLQKILQWVLKPFFTVDAAKLRKINNATFMKSVAYALLQKPDLEIISVWSPTYFLSILQEIKRNQKPWSQDDNLPEKVRQALRSGTIPWEQIWPELKFISAWGSAMAAQGFQEIKKYFPKVTLQKKGLLATEAPLTIPWTKSGGFVPLVEDIFFEFLDEKGNAFIITELKKDATYEMVITTPGGLLRYRLGDLVKVTGMYKQTPCLDFVGRAGDICDMAGEKLSEQAIRASLQDMESTLGFYVMVPDPKSLSYILFSEKDVWSFQEAIDQRLKKIFHYHVARANNQLDGLYCHHLPNLRQEYFRWLESRKMRFGDIKEKALIANLSLAESFLSFVLAEPLPQQPSAPESKP